MSLTFLNFYQLHLLLRHLGTVTFQNVSIDKVGREYRLMYTVTARVNFYQWVGTRFEYSDTFDVIHGDPTALVEITPAGSAWAGGAPFAQQPVIAIVDAGGK